jgi:tetratricopeptide (TPR) repeat protein
MRSRLVVSLTCLLALMGTRATARQDQPKPTSGAGTTEALVLETLRSPAPATEIGMKAAAFTLKDSATEKLRLLIACEIDRSPNPGAAVVLGYTLKDQNGAVVVSHVEPELKSPLRTSRTQMYFGSAAADPGVYTLKLAVIDDAGRRGSVEHTFHAQLTQAGPIRSGDLLIADKAAGGSGLNPSASADITGDTLQGYVELYSDAADALKAVTAEIEVAASADGRAIERSWLRFQDGSGAPPNRRVAEGTVLLAFLQPGSYVARAVISSGGRRVGQVSRPFRIVRASANTAAAPPAADAGRAPETAAPILVISRPDVFEKASVLIPPVLSFFLDKMNASTRGGTTPPAVLEAARAAQFDAALEAGKGSAISRLATVFITGLSLYGKGDLDNAAKQFRETLRLDSEFFPAAFYLGACYAAEGRDSEAAGAWQTSLITLSDAPFIYTLLGDAFLRLHQNDSAVDILTEASHLWPESEAMQVRLGIALAAAGKRAEALGALDPYLAKHPDDHAALLVALRTIYEARSTGKAIATAAEDRQRFDRYAAAYAAAHGPEQALVDQWRKFVYR